MKTRYPLCMLPMLLCLISCGGDPSRDVGAVVTTPVPHPPPLPLVVDRFHPPPVPYQQQLQTLLQSLVTPPPALPLPPMTQP